MSSSMRDAVGDPSKGSAAAEERGAVFGAHYEGLRKLARRFLEQRAPVGTLQPTALVHEAFLRMADLHTDDFRSRTHFLAAAAQAMRHALIDHLRARDCKKRSCAGERFDLDEVQASELTPERLLDLDTALAQLDRRDPRASRVVVLKVFGGLGERAIAAELGISERTVRYDWTFARAWLRCALGDDRGDS
ncbi:MAG: sigma-70 family RNA polymerase sigma factor [Planctomycetes bacterium]|nr:sigma-70 family RNA polymerase sigma factor [Planctomycetota bacterium]